MSLKAATGWVCEQVSERASAWGGHGFLAPAQTLQAGDTRARAAHLLKIRTGEAEVPPISTHFASKPSMLLKSCTHTHTHQHASHRQQRHLLPEPSYKSHNTLTWTPHASSVTVPCQHVGQSMQSKQCLQ